MKSKKINNFHIIKIEKDEHILESLKKYVHENKIGFGTISGIGMIQDVKIGMLKGGSYDWKTFNSDYEMLQLSGNISWVDEKPLLHMHITLSDEKFQVIGGHFYDAKVGAIAEIIITEITNQKIKREQFDNCPFKTWDI